MPFGYGPAAEFLINTPKVVFSTSILQYLAPLFMLIGLRHGLKSMAAKLKTS